MTDNGQQKTWCFFLYVNKRSIYVNTTVWCICCFHGGEVTSNRTVQTTSSPGTAFGTGLHPLIRRGCRHFCTKTWNTSKRDRIYANYTLISSISPPHHCLPRSVVPNNQPVFSLRGTVPNWPDRSMSGFRSNFQNKIHYLTGKRCGNL